MKISINDSQKSSLITVFRLDGQPAVEGQDFASWTGEYHKNGKWSYMEGGVALINGIVLWIHGSTHSHLNGLRKVTVVRDNAKNDHVLMGRPSRTESRPDPIKGLEDVHDILVNAVLDDLSHDAAAAVRQKWDSLSKFL